MSSAVNGSMPPINFYRYTTENPEDSSGNLSLRLSNRVGGLLLEAGITMPNGTEINLSIDDDGALCVDTDDQYEQKVYDALKGDEILYNLIKRHDTSVNSEDSDILHESADESAGNPQSGVAEDTPATTMLNDKWDDEVGYRFRKLLEDAGISAEIIDTGDAIMLDVDEDGRVYVAGNLANYDEVNAVIADDQEMSQAIQSWKNNVIKAEAETPGIYGGMESAVNKHYGVGLNRYDLSAERLKDELAGSEYMPNEGLSWEDAANIEKYRGEIYSRVIEYVKQVDGFANDTDPGAGIQGYMKGFGPMQMGDLDFLDYHYDKNQGRLIVDSVHNNQDQLQALLDSDDDLLAFIASGTGLMQDALAHVENNILDFSHSISASQPEQTADPLAFFETEAASWMSFESTYQNELYYTSFEEDMPEDISGLQVSESNLDSLLDEQIDFAETMNAFRDQVVDILASGDMEAFLDVVEKFVQDNVQMQLDYELDMNQQSYIVTGDQRITLTDDEEKNQQIMDQLDKMGTEYTVMQASSAISGSISFSFATAAKGLTADGGYFEKAFAFDGKFSFGGVSASKLVLPSTIQEAYNLPTGESTGGQPGKNGNGGQGNEDSGVATVSTTSQTTSLSARMSAFFSPDSTAGRIDDFLKGTLELQDFFTNDNGYNTQSNYVDSLGKAVQTGVAKAVYNYTNLSTEHYDKLGKLVEAMTGVNPAANSDGKPNIHSGIMGSESGYDFMDSYAFKHLAKNYDRDSEDGFGDNARNVGILNHQTVYQEYSSSFNADITGIAFAHPLRTTMELITSNLKQMIGHTKEKQDKSQGGVDVHEKNSKFVEHLKELVNKRREEMRVAREEKHDGNKANKSVDMVGNRFHLRNYNNTEKHSMGAF